MAGVEALSSEQRSAILAQCAAMEARVDAFFAGLPMISNSSFKHFLLLKLTVHIIRTIFLYTNVRVLCCISSSSPHTAREHQAALLVPPWPRRAPLHRCMYLTQHDWVYNGAFNLLGLPATVCSLQKLM